eukprot:4270513-Prymnesium_polylepis.2
MATAIAMSATSTVMLVNAKKTKLAAMATSPTSMVRPISGAGKVEARVRRLEPQWSKSLSSTSWWRRGDGGRMRR